MLTRCGSYWGAKLYKTIMTHTLNWTYKANIELMTEREHLDMIEPAIRGGVTSVYDERHFVSINKYLLEYRPSEESTFALC